jgi:ABC-type multidrug transport system permease subunit
LSRSKVFYFKLILLPMALIIILGILFGQSSVNTTSTEKALNISGIGSVTFIPIEWVSSSEQVVSPMQYEAVAMTVLFSFLTAFELTHSVVRDKLNHTMSRIRSTPIKIMQYVVAKLLGITFAIVIQMTVVITSSWIFFKVNWGHVPTVLGITFLYGLAVGSLVLCCGFWAKDHASISSFSAPVLYGFGFLGGSFFNIDSFPPILKKIQEWTPNGKAMNAYLHLCQGRNLSTLLWDMLTLAGVAALFFIMALISAGRKVR